MRTARGGGLLQQYLCFAFNGSTSYTNAGAVGVVMLVEVVKAGVHWQCHNFHVGLNDMYLAAADMKRVAGNHI